MPRVDAVGELTGDGHTEIRGVTEKIRNQQRGNRVRLLNSGRREMTIDRVINKVCSRSVQATTPDGAKAVWFYELEDEIERV